MTSNGLPPTPGASSSYTDTGTPAPSRATTSTARLFEPYRAQTGSPSPSRGSVILYHISLPQPSSRSASPGPSHPSKGAHAGQSRPLLDAKSASLRSSMYSTDGTVHTTEDSKYPVGLLSAMPVSILGGHPGRPSTPASLSKSAPISPSRSVNGLGMSDELLRPRLSSGALVPYEYDPEKEEDPDDAYEDWLHDPDVYPYVDEDVVPRPVAKKTPGAYVPSPNMGLRVYADSDDPERVGHHAPSHRIPTSAGVRPPVSLSHHRNLNDSSQHPYLPIYKKPRTCGPDSLRGVTSVGALVLVVIALLSLFLVFPITREFADDGVDAKILGNTAINSTGQAVVD